MWSLILAGLVFAADPASEPGTGKPKGTPPQIVKARVEGNALVEEREETTYEPVVQTVIEIVNGEKVTTTRMVLVPVMTQSRISRDLTKAKITDGTGAKMDLTTLRKRPAKEGAALVSADGKPIDKGYLDLLDKSAIVIVLPPAPATPAPPIAPAPPVPLPKK